MATCSHCGHDNLVGVAKTRQFRAIRRLHRLLEDSQEEKPR